MRIAINTACYIGRQTGYALQPFAWGPARSATVAAFNGSTFHEQFEQLVATIRGLGVTLVEVWSAHLAPAASPAIVDSAAAILRAHGLSIAAYAASLRRAGLSQAELERTFEIATRLGAPVIAGGLHPAYAADVYALCRQRQIRFAVENHPEGDPLDILAQIDGREDWFGTAVDTGWFKTNDVEAPAAIKALRDHILHVHLKDVRAAGLPHRTCPLGEGVVGIPAVLSLLHQIGYQGVLSIEHEPPHHDPTDELRLSVRRVEAWLGSNVPASGRA